MKQKIGFIGIVQLICIAVSGLISLFALISQESLTFVSFLRWFVFIYVMLMLLSNVLLSHRFSEGRRQEILFLVSTALLVSNLLGTFLKIHPEVSFQHSFIQDDADLKVTISPSPNEKGTVRLAYHPSASFAATRLWSVLSKMLIQ